MPDLKLLLMSILMSCLIAPVTFAADPTRPPGWLTGSTQRSAPSVPVTAFNLQQVLIRADSRSAVINDQLLSVGEKVKGATLISIAPGSVVLKIRQKRVKLSLLNKSQVSSRLKQNRK